MLYREVSLYASIDMGLGGVCVCVWGGGGVCHTVWLVSGGGSLVEPSRISCSLSKRVLHVHQELKMYVILTAEAIQLYMCNTQL